MWYEFSDFSILSIFPTSVQFMLTVRQFSLSLVWFLLLYCCVPNLAVRRLLSSRSVEIQVGLVDICLFSWVSRCLFFDWLSCRSRWSLWSASSTGTCCVVSWRSFYTLDFRLDAPSSPIDCRSYSFSTSFDPSSRLSRLSVLSVLLIPVIRSVVSILSIRSVLSIRRWFVVHV